MSKKSRQRGKTNELAVAKFWGMKRHHFEAEDLHGHPIISVECKQRQADLKTLRKWLLQAGAAAPPDRIPVVHFHALNDQRSNDMIVMYAADLRDIIGKGEHDE